MAKKIKTDFLRKLIIFIIFIVWFIIVFLFSNQTGAESGKVSEKVTEKILQTKDNLEITKDVYKEVNADPIKEVKTNSIPKKRIDKWEKPVRKIAHYILFLCGGFIIYFLTKYSFEIKNNTSIISIFLGVLIACSDEFHQLYTLNRAPKVLDVGIDTAGIITGVIIAFSCCFIIEKINKKRNLLKN